MKSNLCQFETVEARKLFSSTASNTVNVIGETSGVYAAVTTPTFVSLEVTSTDNPSNPAAAADLNTAIRLTISGGSGIDPTNLIRAAVRLTDLTSGKVYKSSDPDSELQRLKTTGGGDALIIQTNDPLTANHQYRVEVNGTYVTSNNRVRDVDGNIFASYTTTFTTGTYLPASDPTINFDQYLQSAPGTKTFACVAIGPDHKLYAGTTDGYIYRYTIGSDGTLSGEQEITTIRDNNGGARIITGIVFDPGSTADNLAIWVSHNQYRIGSNPSGSDDFGKSADNFTGKVSVVSGANLQNYQDKIVGIPRSTKDHMNNQIIFDPSGKNIYFGVAGMNAMGAADTTWGNRVENIYSASIIRAKIGGELGLNQWVHDKGPVNLAIDGDQNTADGLTAGTLHYNIYKGTNPVRLFATGIRNAFNMVFDSYGHLLANVNGSSAGGNVPATPSFSSVPVANRIDKDSYKNSDGSYATYTGPSSGSLTNVRQVEEDKLLNVVEGKYYGHPNPSRGEYIYEGGNPTAGSDNDPFEIAAYPAGQQPDRNYAYPVLDYGTNYSPDGILQYKSVGGKNANLDGYILSTRYSGGADILALKINKDGSVDESATKERINGFTHLGSPLDIVEDMTNGNIYVVSLEIDLSAGSIMLLKPSTSTTEPDAAISPSKLGLYVKPGGSAITRQVTITNNGDADLIFDPTTSRIGGANRKNFYFGANFPTTSVTIAPGASLTLNISGYLAKGQTDTAAATLQLKTNDPDTPYLSIPLRAFNANTTA
ncbi:MAG: Ig-like domain-containing protein [Tepidisphaeraceae bacterium]